MSPLIRSACCSAALVAVTSCGNQASQNATANNAAAGNLAAPTANAAANSSAVANTLGANPAPGNGKLMTIAALAVSTPAQGTVIGSFHMIPSARGIETDGIGGGCLVFEDPADKTCHKDADCHVPSYVPAAAMPWAYCAEQKCWIKPGEKAFCWKSRYSTPPEPLKVGQPKSTPAVKLSSLPAQLFTGPANNQVRARVIACLNGKYDPNDAPPCAGGPAKRADDIGDAKTLTK